MAPYFTTLASKDDYKTLVTPQSGKTIVVAYWPGDATSTALRKALKEQLPRSSFLDYDITDVYCFDVYALPELASELNIDFVPTLMWFLDGTLDAVVWHEGVAVEGESVEKGVSRVVQRIKGSNEVGLEDSDSDW